MPFPFRIARTASRRRALQFATATLATTILAIGACRDMSGPPSPITPRSPTPSNATLADVSQDPAPDQLAVAQVVPGFGGYFIDAGGSPTVYLADANQRPAAEAALAGFLSERGYAASDLRVLHADYEYSQLDAWYRAARGGVFTVSGIVLGDVDESRNRLRYGVTNGSAGIGVQNVLAGLGVPSGAVVVEQRSPIVAMATLRERVRPIIGGLQINFFPVTTTPVTLLCTLGFNAIKDGVASFITNSHCSNVEGGTDTPTDYYQPLRGANVGNTFTPNAANFIGTEVDDPAWQFQVNTDCPPPLACRYSDASRARYAPGVEYTLGRIARIDAITTTIDDTTHTIAGFFTIKAEQANSVVGETANKTGRTTGWTAGPTTETCVDVLALGTTHIRLCQTIVKALVAGGDSGSNVYRIKNLKNGQVVLLGILWGGNEDTENPEFVYSPMSGIERELGQLKTF
jgi:hypothetical protein